MTVFLLKKFDLNLLLIKQKLVADSLVNVYGDSSETEVNKIINDTTFIKSVIQPNSHAHDKLSDEETKAIIDNIIIPAFK